MDQAIQILDDAHHLYARAGGPTPDAASRPPVFKAVGIGLAIGSGALIGTSFVLKKVGLLKANEKYNEVAGEGYGYLKNSYWWGGMILMILGEGLNFAAYAFTDAILVTPLGALSVVITTILSAIFLKERLSMVGKVACFLCIVGSVVIVMNGPQESSVANIQQMQSFVVTPWFLSYAGVVLVGSTVVALWLGPKYGKTNMFVYISICSWVGGLSVVATQGLGAAIIAQAQGTPQFNQWFLYVLLVFIIATLLTEIIYLNKALNLFNAALVTPTYYVYFTSTTIITSTVLFKGFKGTPTSIITVVNGFLTICSGVVLLQLSKSAKDVPDAAVFSGDLDQVRAIAEQEQPETEPKADAIRGTAAIVRRISSARMRMEYEELKRLNEEKRLEQLEPVTEDGTPQFEWDGLRRRRTTIGSHRARSMTSPSPFPVLPTPTPHPPLGWSHFPTEEELAAADRPASPALSSLVGTIRNRARSVLLPGHPDFRAPSDPSKAQSPLHPVQLTEIAVPGQKADDDTAYDPGRAYGTRRGTDASRNISERSGSSSARHVQFGGERGRVPEPAETGSLMRGPTPPPHSAKRQFSFNNIFRRHQAGDHGGDGAQDARLSRPGSASRGYSSPLVKGSTEEERLGLVKGDSHTSRSAPALQLFKEEEEEEVPPYTDDKELRYGPSITHTPPRRGSDEKAPLREEDEIASYEEQRRRFKERSQSGDRNKSSGNSPPRPPPHGRRHSRPDRGNGRGGDGAFI
ncbi:putative non-imprinted in prader-willi angelman syndrome region protein 2 protein [Podospora aff. communis PSN243]|uniref:Non-imprinted in prader-willi angelman syndrome region protein 2 protein n=1 Tax=Podospora aff. communis PSN243 TaxID=3040156 RepID=A0AAV9GBB0_9PEZI|nr:putative non-imprinted in prader-willi angelman syndrome region protein 2 protein [Podospora aff. communis PSN243]